MLLFRKVPTFNPLSVFFALISNDSRQAACLVYFCALKTYVSQPISAASHTIKTAGRNVSPDDNGYRDSIPWGRGYNTARYIAASGPQKPP